VYGIKSRVDEAQKRASSYHGHEWDSLIGDLLSKASKYEAIAKKSRDVLGSIVETPRDESMDEGTQGGESVAENNLDMDPRGFYAGSYLTPVAPLASRTRGSRGDSKILNIMNEQRLAGFYGYGAGGTAAIRVCE
jgi:hypothetical protein